MFDTSPRGEQAMLEMMLRVGRRDFKEVRL
jgi:hypothetical protein